MYLMYVDESGDTGLVNSPTRNFILSSIVVHESNWRVFVDRLVGFKKKMRLLHGLPLRTEIHSVEFLNSKVAGLDRFKRLAILRNALDELASMDFISITSVVIDKTNKPANFDVFEAAWSMLFQRFENTMQAGNFPGSHKTDYGMVLTDATNGRALQRMVRRMAVFNMVPNTSYFGGGSRNLPIRKIIEDPHSKDSKDSLPIQMCDVVAYFLKQRIEPNKYIKKSRAHLYFDRLDPVLNKAASRTNNLGTVFR